MQLPTLRGGLKCSLCCHDLAAVMFSAAVRYVVIGRPTLKELFKVQYWPTMGAGAQDR